ncbi:hypothetical protein C8Q73DRAFT_661558 [Cubamyces lactineus]|nr:hypothetical protein C8Q73DRAFT_661558 [Cubamyces lactineus]
MARSPISKDGKARQMLCPLEALKNLADTIPAAAHTPLFSWQDKQGETHPMVRDTALSFINGWFIAMGFGTTYGHSFQIGGVSFYLSQKVDPEVIRLMGQWQSLAYQVYICAFEEVTSRHTANLAAPYGL